MSIPFSDVIGNTGICEQVRYKNRVNSTQWSNTKIANSCNDWLDFIAGYAIQADKRFQWDDTNHSKLPEGTTSLVINQTDYSFLTDEQGNTIITLTGISVLTNGKYIPLILVDRNDPDYDKSTFGTQSGTPTRYDKIADNIIRLDKLPPATIASGLKFFFQRVGSYFLSTDTTKTPGVSPLLHKGFVVAAQYDCASALGLQNLQTLAVDLQLEKQKAITAFSDRNKDQRSAFGIFNHSNK